MGHFYYIIAHVMLRLCNQWWVTDLAKTRKNEQATNRVPSIIVWRRHTFENLLKGAAAIDSARGHAKFRGDRNLMKKKNLYLLSNSLSDYLVFLWGERLCFLSRPLPYLWSSAPCCYPNSLLPGNLVTGLYSLSARAPCFFVYTV